MDTKGIAHSNGAERIHTHFDRGRIRFQKFIYGLENEENLTFYKPAKSTKWTTFDKYQSCRWKAVGLEVKMSPVLKALHIMPEQRMRPT